MIRVIDGAEYNTNTAKKICETYFSGPDYDKGAITKTFKQLFKTRSGKYFFYIVEKFTAHADINDDDINPIFEEMELMDKRIVPASYDLALQFVDEVKAGDQIEDAKMIRKHFPELVEPQMGKEEKFQKKIYLSERANWYLQMMVNESEDTNSSIVERLIIKEYRKLYQAGVMNRDPFSEMEDLIEKE